MKKGDFVTVIGGNGAGKSTMLNVISGVYYVESGSVILDDKDITKKPEYKRARYLGRVFQDPMKGTAADLSIEENLHLHIAAAKQEVLDGEYTEVNARIIKNV